MAIRTPSSKRDMLLLAALFTLELSLTVLAMAMYVKGERTFAVILSGKHGAVVLMAVAALLVSGAVLVWLYFTKKQAPSRHFRLIVMMNLVTVLLILITAEISVRIIASSSPEGERIGNMVLMPKRWASFASHHRQVLDRASGFLSYLVYDDLMGWTVGPNRARTIGRYWPVPYWSSSEGIRAPHEGISFAQVEGKTRIALVGDSFTFGAEVAYEDTWGDHLDRTLGSEFQVLNFGVDAYGVGQAYLRYKKDVRKWDPKIVIFGFISQDFKRTAMVYNFLSWLNLDFPFSKPRFVLRDGVLTPLNVPPLTPEDIFSRESISDLPFLKHDIGYRHDDWHKSSAHFSYLIRLFESRFPRYRSVVDHDRSDEAIVSINASILNAFLQEAEQAGTVPLLVYFPEKHELEHSSVHLPIGKRVLQQSGFAYTDVTPCLLEVNPTDRFVPSGRHYSPLGNAAVAKCLLNAVRHALAQAS